jgi:hypothetical protein
MQKLFLLVFSIFSLAAASLWAADADGDRFYVGTHVGHVIQNESGADSRTGFGGKFGYHFNPAIDAGIYLLFSETSEHSALFNRDLEASDLFGMVAVNYHLKKVLKGLRIGAKLGFDGRAVNIVTPLGDTKSIDTATLAYGFEAGYDYKFRSGFFVGAEVNHLAVGSDEKTIKDNNTDITVKYDSTSFVNILASLGWRF